jgi:hypothetical protein
VIGSDMTGFPPSVQIRTINGGRAVGLCAPSHHD